MIYILLCIILLVYTLLLLTQNNVEKFINYKLRNVNISINDDYLNLITHNDSALYSSYNIKTFDTWVGYFNKMYECILKNPNRKTILLLGFGMGAIPQRLSKDKFISTIDCVDNDNELFIYFKKIFPSFSNKINLYNFDANTYLFNCKKKYDIIIDDVFDGLNKIELDYYLIKQKLNKNGILYLNNYDKNNKNINIVKKIKMIFGNGVNMPINNIKSQSVYLFDNKI